MDHQQHEVSIRQALESLARKIKHLRQEAGLTDAPVSAKDLNSSGMFSAEYNKEPAGSFKRVSNFLLFFICQLLSEDETAIKKTLENPNDLTRRFFKLATDMAAFSTTSSTVPTVIGAKETMFHFMQDMRKTEDDAQAKLLMDYLDEFLSLVEQRLPSGKANKLFPELIAKFKFENRRTTFMYEANLAANVHLSHKKEFTMSVTRGVGDLGIRYAAECMKLRAAKSSDTKAYMLIFENWLKEYRVLFEKIKDTPMEILFYTNMAGDIQTMSMKRELLQQLKAEFDPKSVVGLGCVWNDFRESYKSDVADIEFLDSFQSDKKNNPPREATIVAIDDDMIEISSAALNKPYQAAAFNAKETAFSEQADAFEQILLEFYKQVSEQLEIQEKVQKPLKDYIKTFTDIFNRMEKMLANVSPELICKARYYLKLMDHSPTNDSPAIYAFAECIKDMINELMKLPIFENKEASKIISDLIALKQTIEQSNALAKQMSKEYFNADESAAVVFPH